MDLPVLGLKLFQIRLSLPFVMKTSNLRQVLLLGVAKLSVMRGYFLLCMCKWDQISVCYSGVANVLKCMEKRLGHSEVSVILWVSAVEGCPLSGVPLY